MIEGPATKKIKKIAFLEKKFPKNLKVINETSDMAREISKSRFGISGGGLTSYEFACMHVPFAIICQAKHQLMTASAWEKKGVAMNLGLVKRNSKKEIEKIFDNIIKGRMPYQMKKTKLVDGLGSHRVANEILKIN